MVKLRLYASCVPEDGNFSAFVLFPGHSVCLFRDFLTLTSTSRFTTLTLSYTSVTHSDRQLKRKLKKYLHMLTAVKPPFPLVQGLDKTKFYVVGAGIFTGITVALYPISVVKTRLQVASADAVERNAFSVIKGILKADGITGLYRGFGTVITGAIPARIIFLTALETTKVAALRTLEPFKLSEPTQAAIANGTAGMIASLSSQAVFVPIDVVSQRLMVQGYSGHATYNGGLDVVRKVVKADGIRGLYRGFGLSVMTYSPSSAVWWASYGSSQRLIWRLLDQGNGSTPSQGTIVLVQAAGGILAGATASCITTPLDTIKTRLQVMGHEMRPTARQVVRNLIKNDGWTGFYRGLGPRFFSMSAWGTSMILAYEYLKRLCVKE